ncbi:ribosomal RNA small subunit methyltransferase B [Lachnospiraceae bacterium KM106-2]|nr:ribosomal RNA small subunit methyltransferase B [Lachnospiraceae bacterium KM106-2]
MTNQKDTLMVRELSLDILIEVLEKGSYSHKTIHNVLANYQYMEKQDRAFLTRLCEGTIEHVLLLDYVINQFSSVKVKKMKPVIRNILRMGVYQIKYMSQVPDSAACNEAVKLAKKRGFKNLSGFVNGVLRNIGRNLDQIKYPDKKKEPVRYLSIMYSTPEWIIEEWMESYDLEMVENVLAASLEDRPTTIRVNTNKISKEDLIKKLEAEQISVLPGVYNEDALRIQNYNYLAKMESFQNGEFNVQDESSMLVGVVADVKENDKIIDVCAAPGGKSLHAGCLLKGTGTVSSRDVSYDKVAMLEDNVKRLGLTNVHPEVRDALILYKEDIEQADIVLADLPCSGLGVIGKKHDIKYNMSREQQQELVSLQREILDQVTQYVKPGGVLIYSTCTIHKGENEDNVEWILDHYPFELESIDPYIPDALKNETTKKGYLQFLPGREQTDGFFLARFRKK